ncbi:citrate synthase [Burkholderiaceae bacterium 16]|nr:citrate synthase [Burkholderiaceae bacterium 16]
MSQANRDKPASALCRHNAEAIWYRDQNLVDDLLGKQPFVATACRHILGRELAPGQLALIEAILIVLMEHGMTPSAISARLIYMSSPESLQAGVAAGLLGVGSAFIGTMEDCARMLAVIADAAQPDAADTAARTLAQRLVSEKRTCPGFGHHLHTPDDPRAIALLALAERHGVAGRHTAALRRLAAALDEARGRHLTINATGAVAAILGDIGVPVGAMRGFALLSRTAGLVAHLLEEQETPSGRFIWKLVDQAIPFSAQEDGA